MSAYFKREKWNSWEWFLGTGIKKTEMNYWINSWVVNAKECNWNLHFFSCQFHSQMENTHTQMLLKLQTKQKCLTRCVCIIYVTDQKWHGSWQCKTVRTVLTKYSVSYKHCKVKLMNPSFKDPYTVCTYHVCFNSPSEREEMVHCSPTQGNILKFSVESSLSRPISTTLAMSIFLLKLFTHVVWAAHTVLLSHCDL